MKMLIHDLEYDALQALYRDLNDEIIIISNNNSIKHCVGCFGCWVKTPGSCMLQDEYSQTGKKLSQCDELIIISKCYYGGFSPFVKNVLDRSIGYMLPHFTIRNKEMHHKSRYKNQIKISAYVYGEDMKDKEKETLKMLVKANGLNFNSKENSVSFCNTYLDIPSLRRSL